MQQYVFFKMHGLGNDYIFIDGRSHALPVAEKEAPVWCDRHRGIGADGIVFILPSVDQTAKMRIFNADGSEAQMCGNALRCIGKYLDDRNELADGVFSIETIQRTVTGRIIERGTRQSMVAVDMGIPEWAADKIPVHSDAEFVIRKKITFDKDMEFCITCVSMGNPHCVIEVNNVHHFPVQTYGPLIENSSLFPERTNVGFMEKKDDGSIELRVWERGSGETKACGSGACAAYAVWSRIHDSSIPLHIRLPGGTLKLSFMQETGGIIQEGPATFVFNGQISGS